MKASILLLLIVSACGVDQERLCRLEKLAELPVELRSSVPVLTVEINGKPASMILDTGSDSTVLTRIAARRLGVAEGGAARQLSGAGGNEQLTLAQIDHLSVGGIHLERVQVLLGDAPRPPIDGLLGIDVLVGYELELDLPHRRAALYRARQCATARPDWDGPLIQLPVQQQARSGHLFVPVHVDGEPLRAMLDTGASATTLSLQSAEDVRVSGRRLAALPSQRGQSVNAGGISIRGSVFREMRVGTDVIERPRLAIVDLPASAGDMLLGSDYLATRRVWFSFLIGRVFVQSAATAVGGDALVRDP